ncbi:hypothetical protein DM02DRAFT_244802 [Periconia macrospinosa]|uniref:2EXR domain-containing protein n=1 Tax=Periconia macrospinosa TaxID=97972 RepID=A0A2V1E1H9_9PLEO|nr:hypothetical protein DM02DRAFT_244802 [Periconia macrospinosa]
MYKPPSTPRYTRATEASKAKRSPKSRSYRSSTFRDVHANTVVIPPADPKKMCPLAILPAEIRLLIYNYVLPQGPVLIDATPRPRGGINERTRNRWPAILRVCRLIRKEAAHEFYAKTPFEAYIFSFEICSPNWTTYVSKTDFDSLAQNRNMTMLLPCFTTSSHIPSWQQSKNFGNIYDIGRKRCQNHFLTFCTLAKWWLQCGQHSMRNVDWRYNFWQPNYRHDIFYMSKPHEYLWAWLFEKMSTVVLPCVQQNWTRSSNKRAMKKPALGMLEALDREFKEAHPIAKQKALSSWLLTPGERAAREFDEDKKENEWNTRVQLLRRHLHKW